MKNFIEGDFYARLRLFSGGLFVVFGAIIIARTYLSVGLSGSAIPAFVLGAAMMALGVYRYRLYLAARARR